MERKRQAVLAGVLTVLLGMLGVFKYGGWMAGICGGSLSLILPLGLSFYIFQSLGYCIDVYRGEFPAEKNLLRHALFVSFFPQLLQGPIGSYSSLAPQLCGGRDFDYHEAVFGLQRVVWGFFKKLVIANHIALLIDDKWTSQTAEGFVLWSFVLFLYSIQLYADFSGYMDIACGCSQMLGIRLDENFDSPYLSKSISEFWRRWHITLGAWFKNYLFYSLLRSDAINRLRKRFSSKYLSSAIPTALSLLVVWILIGLWHGADFCYIFYGLYHGLFVILGVFLESQYRRFRETCERRFGQKVYTAFQMFRTFAIVTFGYVLFRPGSIGATVDVLSRMFSRTGVMDCAKFVGVEFRDFVVIGFSSLVLVAVDAAHYKGVKIRDRIHGCTPLARWMVYISSVVLILLFGAYGKESLNQFAYFRF